MEFITGICDFKNEPILPNADFKDKYVALKLSSITPISNIGSNEEGTVTVALYGEINNYKQLLRSLESSHDFRSINLAEVVAHLYEKHGIKALNMLRGAFSLVIWDSQNKKLILSKDVMSGKTLFYTIEDGRILFSSRIIDVLKYSNKKHRINRDTLNLYLSLTFIPSSFTMVTEIKKIPSATALIFQKESISMLEYWQPSFNFIYAEESEDLIDTIYHTLREAIQIRMSNSNKTVATFVSGGLDSGLIAAILKRLSPNDKVKAFTVGFEYKKYNELDAARRVAEYLGLEHRTSILTGDEVLNFLSDLYKVYSEPMFDDSAIATFKACEIAKNHTMSVFSGEAADTVFYGLSDVEKIVNNYKRIPKTLRYRVLDPILLNFTFGEFRRKMEKLISFSRDHFSIILNEKLIMPEEEILRLYNSDSCEIKRTATKFITEIYARAMQKSPNYSDRSHYITFKSGELADAILKLDGICNYMNMTLKLPFTDSKVLELAFKIDPKLKLKNNTSKYLLKKVALKYNLLPRKTIYRKKHGFGTPIEYWFLKELKNEVYNGLVENPSIEKIFDKKRIIKELEKLARDKRHKRACLLWGIFIFIKWYERYSQYLSE